MFKNNINLHITDKIGMGIQKALVCITDDGLSKAGDV